MTPGRLAEMEPPAGLVGFLSMRSFTKQRVSRLSRVQPTQLGRESHRAQQRLMFIVLSTYDLEPMLWPPAKIDTIAGFGFDDCEPLRGDQLEGEIRFRGSADLSALKGRNICLCLELFRATVFSTLM